MSPREDHDIARETPHDHAAHWMALRRSGEMSAREEREFQVWLARDPAHRAAYDDLERHWRTLGAVGDDEEIMAIYERSVRRDGRAAGLRRGGAVAAGLALIAAAGWGVRESGLFNGFSLQRETQGERFETAVGERRLVSLPDGSLATLDTDSVLTTEGWGRTRGVELVRGRAYFQVVRDPYHRFVVSAAGRTVTAVGTAFDVSVDRRGVEVVLAQGRVKVEQPARADDPAQSIELRPGWRLSAHDAARWKMEQVDVSKATSWLSGRLDFNEDTLGDAVAQMNRYATKKIVLADESLETRPIIGVFSAGDTESFVKALRIYGIARVENDTDDAVTLAAP